MTESLYLKIREERIKQGLSQKELGEMVGLPQQAINRIEQGQRKLDVELFEKLCQVLKIKKIGSFSVNFISSYYQTEPIGISEYEQQQKEEAAKKAPKFYTRDKKGNIIKDGKPPKFTTASRSHAQTKAYELFHSLLSEDWVMSQEQETTAVQLREILGAYEKLNDNGKKEAVKRIDELTHLPHYTKPDEPPQD